ncbi:MAG: cation:proton antiporter [Candidatus Woesebacteria bacterium]
MIQCNKLDKTKIMESNLFLVLSLVIVLAVAVSSAMRLLKQPQIIGYILTGILVGPSFLGMIPDKAPFEAFSNIGIALLLFIIGLGLNTDVIKRLGKVVLTTATVQIIASAVIGYGTALMLGFSQTEAIIAGVALTFSSTIIIIKIFTDKREQTRLYAQISLGILLVQDIVASAALVCLAAVKTGDVSPGKLIILAIQGAFLALTLMLISGKILPRFSKFIAGSQEFLFLFALAWGFGIATLFEATGFSIEVGALFAGVSLASLPYAQEVAARLKPLRDFFVVVFFIALGEGLQLSDFGSAIMPALVFSFIVIAIKPLTAMISMGFLGYTKRTSFKAASSLGQVSEFSLVFVVMALAAGIVPQSLNTAITLAAIITIAVSTYIMKYSEQIFAKLEHSLRFFERKTIKPEKTQMQSYPLVLFGYHKGGDEYVKSFKALRKRFVVVDYNPEVIEDLEHKHTPHLYGDATDLELLQEMSIEKTKMIVSTIADFEVNKCLVNKITRTNPHVIFICSADNYTQAAALYHAGATYVTMPHLIGSEKIGSFIKRAKLNKQEFATYRDKHLMLLEKKAD